MRGASFLTVRCGTEPYPLSWYLYGEESARTLGVMDVDGHVLYQVCMYQV